MNPGPCLIFDLDGTLSDPALGIGRSINYALVSCGYAPIPDQDVSQCIGPPLDTTFARLTHSSSKEHTEALVAKYRERYAQIGYAENTLYAGIPETLAVLADSGLRLGVCTSKRVDFAEQILKMFELRDFFAFVNGGEVGVQKSEQLGSLLADGIIQIGSTMVGDRAVDIHAAKMNGMQSVGVLWGHGSEHELQEAGPDLLLRSIQELRQFTAI